MTNIANALIQCVMRTQRGSITLPALAVVTSCGPIERPMVPGLMEREAVSIVISMSGLGGRSSSKTAELTPLTFVSIKYVRGHAFPSASDQLRTEQYGAA